MDVLWIKYVLSTPPLGGSRDPYSVERFSPYLLAVIPAHFRHLVHQPYLRFLHPTFVGCRLRDLGNFPGHPGCIFSFLQLGFKIHDQLSLGGQLYLNEMKLLTLVLGILQARLGTQTRPFLSNQLAGELLVLLFSCTQGLVGLGAKVSLDPGFVPGVIDPFIGHKNFLDSL